MLCGTAVSLRALSPLAPTLLAPSGIALSTTKQAAPGGTVRMRVAMTNTTAMTVAGQLRAFVPSSLGAPQAPGASITPSPGGVVVGWDIAGLAPGAALGGAAVAVVPPGSATPLTRTIVATATLVGAPPLVVTTSRDVGVRRTDVRLELGTDALDVRPTEAVTHGVAIDNLSASATEGAVITLTLDAATTFVTDTLDASGAPWPPAAVTRTVGLGYVSWRLPPLAGPRRVAFHVVTRLAADAPGGGNVIHAIAFRADTVDANPLDDQVTAPPVPIVVPDLWIRKSGPPDVEPGGPVDYAITWGNAGGRARDVVITDTLPPGTVWISSTPSAEILDAGRVRWLRGTGPTTGGDPLEVIRVRVAVDAGVAAGTLLTNHAAIGSSAPDAAPSDDADTAATVVSGAGAVVADLYLASSGTGFVAPGGQASYAVTLTNGGPAAAEATVLTATLPISFSAATVSPGGAIVGARVVRWLFGALSPGASRDAMVTATVAADAPVGVTRTLQFVAASSAPPGNAADDTVLRAIRIVPTDVRVSLMQVGPAVPGDIVRHTITITNDAPAAADDLVVTLALDPDLHFASDDLADRPGIGPFVRTLPNGAVRWTFPRLPGGGTWTWVVASNLDSAVPVGRPVTATLAAIAATRDAHGDDDEATVAQPAMAPPVATLTIAAPTSLPVGGASAPVTVTLRDAVGQPVPDGTRVRLATTAGVLAAMDLASAGGRVVTRLTSPNVAQVATITATSGRQASANVVFRPGPTDALNVNLTPSTAVVGDVGTTVRIQARDAFGNPVADGTSFMASVDGGNLARTLGSTVGGMAEVNWTSTRSGSNVVTVDVAPRQATATVFWWPGLPERLSVHADDDDVPIGTGRTRVEVTAYDAFGNRVLSGFRAEYSASLGSVVPSSAELVDGVASTTWAAPSTHGMAAIEAVMTRSVGDTIAGTALVRARAAELAIASALTTPRGPAATTQLFPGDEVSYTLHVANNGLIVAEDVVLEVDLPDEMFLTRVVATDDVFQRDPGGGLLYAAPASAGRPYAWDLPDLAPGRDVTVTLVGTTARDRAWTGSDSIFFRATVETASDSEVEGPLHVADITRVVAGDLFIGLRLDESASQIRPGGELVYDAFFGNNQAQTEVLGARITDTLPVWTTFDHWQAPQGLAVREAQPFKPSDRTLVWVVEGVVPVAGSLRVWLRIADDAPPQTFIINAVAIDSAVLDIASGNDDAIDGGAWIAGVDLVAGLTGPRALEPGASARYEASVLNAARRDRALGVGMVVQLPTGMTVVAAPPDAEVTPGRVAWPVGSIGAGARKRFTLDLAVSEGAVPGQRLKMSAAAAGDVPDSNPANDRSELEVLVAEAGSTRPASVSVRAVPSTTGACPPNPMRIIASVLDGNGLEVADGATVRFSTTRGVLSAPITTTVEGQAVVTLTFGGPGQAVVTADADPLTPATVPVTGTAGAPNVLSIAATTTAPALRSRVPLTVEARDRCGRSATDGWPIRLVADRGQFVGGGASVVLETVGGRVTAVLDVGSQPGTLRITADHGGRRTTLDLDVRGVVEPTATPRVGGGAIYLPSLFRRTR